MDVTVVTAAAVAFTDASVEGYGSTGLLSAGCFCALTLGDLAEPAQRLSCTVNTASGYVTRHHRAKKNDTAEVLTLAVEGIGSVGVVWRGPTDEEDG